MIYPAWAFILGTCKWHAEKEILPYGIKIKGLSWEHLKAKKTQKFTKKNKVKLGEEGTGCALGKGEIKWQNLQ